MQESLALAFVAAARDDWAWVEAGIADPSLPPAPLGFHAQQAIEKLLKGLLVAFGVEFEEHHNLGRLVEQVRRLDRSTADAVARTSQLTPFAVLRRYPPRHPAAARPVERSEVVRVVEEAREACPVLESAIMARLAKLHG